MENLLYLCIRKINTHIMSNTTDFKKGDTVEYNNGKHKERFIVVNISEYHLYSTKYNLPSFNKKYCKKVN